ncbi:ABC transporter permease [Clostridiaceae bacterium M8S5]|nr:ABC transporter permease [Clostridiaceae bacterium M8S5]
MKLVKLALSNVKRDISNYIMYVIALSVCVFSTYTLLAIKDNKFVYNSFREFIGFKTLMPVFTVIILVFAVEFLISSNNSFIKARKKEISTFALFGMTNMDIGLMLTIETFIVGVTSLIIGITTGVVFSKLMVMILLTITLPEITTNITFAIGFRSILYTTVIYLFIFAVMSLFGMRVINKFQLVDLFKAHKMSEKKSKGSYIMLIVGLALIAYGYFMACNSDTYYLVKHSIPILILVIIGTYLFFWSGLPKVLNIIKKNKRNYSNGLKLISTSSLSHKMRTISSVMSSIAILSAVATTAIASAFTLYYNVERSCYKVNGFDMYFYESNNSVKEEVMELLKRHNNEMLGEITIDRFVTYPKIVFNSNTPDNGKIQRYTLKKDTPFRVYTESTYNKAILLSRYSDNEYKQLSLNKGEVILISRGAMSLNHSESEDLTNKLISYKNKQLEIVGNIQSGIFGFGLDNILILNDEDFKELLASGEISNKTQEGNVIDKATVIKYEKPLSSTKLNKELNNALKKASGYRLIYNNYINDLQTFGLICFIGFFMGIVFIFMTASLLYFKQIMAAKEDAHQYKMLSKLGIDEDMERKLIAKRIKPVFFMPLIIGIVHSVFAMRSANTVIFHQIVYSKNTYLSVMLSSLAMYCLYGAVYGLFYLITKGQYTKIIKSR